VSDEPDQLLADVSALQHPEERLRRAGEIRCDRFAVFEFSRTQELRELPQRGRPQVEPVRHEEALDLQTLTTMRLGFVSGLGSPL